MNTDSHNCRSSINGAPYSLAEICVNLCSSVANYSDDGGESGHSVASRSFSIRVCV